MDAFDRFWQWADKPLESPLTIPAELHRAVMELAPPGECETYFRFLFMSCAISR